MRLDHDIVCFGKIPEHGDFVRYNADGPAARELDAWFQEGLHASQFRFEHSLTAIAQVAPPRRFVYCPTTTPVLLLGVMQMSEDATGRTYPFVVATEMPRTKWSGLSKAHLPVSSVSFLKSVESLVRDAVTGHISRSSLKERLLDIDPQTDGSDVIGEHEAIRLLDLITFKELSERIWGSFDDSRKYLLFKNLSDALTPFRSQIPTRCSLGLRFPIALPSVSKDNQVPLLRDAPAEVTVGFWYRLVHAIADLKNVARGFFWQAWDSSQERSGVMQTQTSRDCAPGSKHDPNVLYFFRPPPPNAFTQLLPVHPSEKNVCDLEASGEEQAAVVALSISHIIGEVLESESASLLDVIDAVRAWPIAAEPSGI